MSPNMSLVGQRAVRAGAAGGASCSRGKDFDVEIVERHHRFKKDSPSGHGPALRPDRAGGDGPDANCGTAARGWSASGRRHEIGMHAVRVGDNVGEHTIIFSTLGETLELVHKGHTPRQLRPRGAAGGEVPGRQAAGRYTMNDVLGM